MTTTPPSPAHPTTSATKTYEVCVSETEYKRAYIEATSAKEAERLAWDSLHGEISEVDWKTVDWDPGPILVEEI